MKTVWLIACVIWLLIFSLESQAQKGKLPPGAKILEIRSIAQIRPNRTLVLWMLNPAKNPSGFAADETYPCPADTRGSYYSGPTRVSLWDTGKNRIINTIQVQDIHLDGKDTFDIPYKIRKGLYYYVRKAKAGVEEKPVILWLKDYNGDGQALEFALFDAPACMGLETALIGYSQAQDKLVQYQIELQVTHDGKQTKEISQWSDYLFGMKPIAPGHWKFEVDYRGRGGWLARYDIHYNARTERFEGILVTKDK